MPTTVSIPDVQARHFRVILKPQDRQVPSALRPALGADFGMFAAMLAPKAPEIWRAITGTAEPVSYRTEGGQTVVSLDFASQDSFFVVFRKPASGPSLSVAKPAVVPVATPGQPLWLDLGQVGDIAEERVKAIVHAACRSLVRFAVLPMIVGLVIGVNSGLAMRKGSVRSRSHIS